MTKKKADRDTVVRVMYRKGATQEQIAEKLSVSRQRVQQIEKRLGLRPRRDPELPKVTTFICSTCYKSFSARGGARKYCSRPCFATAQKVSLTKDERKKRMDARREINRQRSRDYYYNVFKKQRNWRTIVRKRNEAYVQRHKERV